MKSYKCGHHGTTLEVVPVPDEGYGDSLREYGACRDCFPELFPSISEDPNSDPLTWLVGWVVEHWNDSIPVIIETFEDQNAPDEIIQILLDIEDAK